MTEFLQSPWFKFIIIAAIIVVIIIVITNMIKRIHRKITTNVISPIRDIVNGINQVRTSVDNGDFEEKKSVGGATSLYLPKIMKDFPQFHKEDAESEVKTVLENYLYYRYGTATEFNTSLVNQNLFKNLTKESSGNVSQMVFNGIAIYAYEKSKEYATILYKVSVGFNIDSKRIETRYSVKYTNQLSEHEIASVGMKCPNCGAPLGETKYVACPYCNAKIIKDTIMNWAVTSIEPDFRT